MSHDHGVTDWLHSPMCPHCGDEVTESPMEDLAANGEIDIECGGCEQMVRIEGRTETLYRARKVEA